MLRLTRSLSRGRQPLSNCGQAPRNWGNMSALSVTPTQPMPPSPSVAGWVLVAFGSFLSRTSDGSHSEPLQIAHCRSRTLSLRLISGVKLAPTAEGLGMLLKFEPTSAFTSDGYHQAMTASMWRLLTSGYRGLFHWGRSDREGMSVDPDALPRGAGKNEKDFLKKALPLWDNLWGLSPGCTSCGGNAPGQASILIQATVFGMAKARLSSPSNRPVRSHCDSVQTALPRPGSAATGMSYPKEELRLLSLSALPTCGAGCCFRRRRATCRPHLRTRF